MLNTLVDPKDKSCTCRFPCHSCCGFNTRPPIVWHHVLLYACTKMKKRWRKGIIAIGRNSHGMLVEDENAVCLQGISQLL